MQHCTFGPKYGPHDRYEDLEKREIAISRRDAAQRSPIEITDRTRICNNCNISIVNEIRILNEDPNALRLNILSQTSSHTCLICNGNNNLTRLTLKARVNIYLNRDIYTSKNVKSCLNHLDDQGFLLREFFQDLRFVNRPCIIKGNELKQLLEELRNNCTSGSTID